jgi:hypothetical protein
LAVYYDNVTKDNTKNSHFYTRDVKF